MIKMFYSYLDLLKVYDFYVKLELSCCRIYCVNLPSSIDRIRLDRLKLGQNVFL